MKYTFRIAARLLPLLLLFCDPASAQFNSRKKNETSKSAAAIEADMVLLRKDMAQLASPQMEGRKAGTKGEMMALNYLEQRFQSIGLGFFENKYRRGFKFTVGREMSPETKIYFNNEPLKIPEDAFPMPFSAPGESEGYILPNSMEPNSFWVIPLFDNQAMADAPGFDLARYTYDKAIAAMERGATGVVFYDDYGGKNAPVALSETKHESLSIPVWIIRQPAFDKCLKGLKTIRQIRMNTMFRNIYGDAANIFGYINNNAARTVIISAHFDGMGIDAGGRLYPGANDNASGVAALLRVAALVRKSDFKKYNYLFAGFSCGNMDADGVKKFMEAKSFDASKIAYQINLDQVGLLAPSRPVIIGGVGTADNWKAILNKVPNALKPVYQNRGNLESGHVEFYKQRVPYLYFYTGKDEDNNTPDDVITRINFKGIYDITDYVFGIIGQMETEPQPKFKETSDEVEVIKAAAAPNVAKENKSSASTSPAQGSQYPVSLGISPEINDGNDGVAIATLAPGKPAAVAGLIKNDVIVQIGSYPVQNIQDYMDALTKFNRGAQTMVKIKRGGRIQQYSITFQ